ncbi:unnamed protein product [Periconia digitata]|uniref:Uncharacterized protein n=1 Tax=Periconia digitata TaxID=1303443 RepID=A0A9W4UMW1_9PLEO|nr:unnamed protein product [Periconia digitata]
MVGYTQQDLIEATIDNDFYYEEDPEENEETGGFRTHNPADNRFQRSFIRLSPTKSKFQKRIEMILCIHGWEDATHKQPMTLMVFDCHLSCNDKKYRIQSSRIWFQFGEDSFASTADSHAKASPEVVAFAPFAKTAKWNDTELEIRRKHGGGGKVGVDYVAKVEGNVDGEKEVSFTQKHFDRGTCGPILDEKSGNVVGTQWYMEQNDLQKYGVAPDFKLALLVKRSNHADGKGVNFQGIFDMRIEAGFQHDVEEGIRRFLRLYKPEDDPVYFNPELEDHIRGPQAKKLTESVKRDVSGQVVKDSLGKEIKLIRKDALGELVDDEVLAGLLYSDIEAGLVSGLEPFNPKY